MRCKEPWFYNCTLTYVSSPNTEFSDTGRLKYIYVHLTRKFLTQIYSSGCALLQNLPDWANQLRGSYHLPENQYNWKTNSSMNMKVGDIIQYYAYKISDVLDQA